MIFTQSRKWQTRDGITLRNCHLKKARHLLNLQGDERKPIKNVILENVTLDECTGEKFRIKNAEYKIASSLTVR